MIYTFTPNPSLDYVITTNTNSLHTLTRMTKESFNLVPGGKGLNVTQMLSNLKVSSTAIMPLKNGIGDFMDDVLRKNNIKIHKLDAPEEVRINVKINTLTKQYELNGPAFPLIKEARDTILTIVSSLEKGDIFVISGTIHKSDEKFILRIISRIKERKADFVLDTASMDLFKTALSYEPLLIKPNLVELSQFFNFRKTVTKKQIIHSLVTLNSLGAKNVSITLGGKGSYNLLNGKIYFIEPIKIQPISAVASGDAFVAGFLKGYVDNPDDLINILKNATASATATVLSFSVGTKRFFDIFKPKVKISEVTNTN